MTSKGKGFSKGQKGQKQNEKYKKFIGNRSEGQGFADKRKKKIQYEYMKMMKKEKLRERLQQAVAGHKVELNTPGRNQNISKNNEQRKERQDKGSTVEHLPKAGSSTKGPTGSPSKKPGTRHEIVQQDSRQKANPERKFKGKPTERHQNMFRKGGKMGKEGATRFSKAAEENRQRKETKLQKQQEYAESKTKRDAAMGAYQKRKQETFKKICKKTHKGQPVMKNQIEYLLQKIEKQVNQR